MEWTRRMWVRVRSTAIHVWHNLLDVFSRLTQTDKETSSKAAMGVSSRPAAANRRPGQGQLGDGTKRKGFKGTALRVASARGVGKALQFGLLDAAVATEKQKPGGAASLTHQITLASVNRSVDGAPAMAPVRDLKTGLGAPATSPPGKYVKQSSASAIRGVRPVPELMAAWREAVTRIVQGRSAARVIQVSNAGTPPWEAAKIPLHDIKLSQRVLMAGAGTLFITAVSTLMAVQQARKILEARRCNLKAWNPLKPVLTASGFSDVNNI